MDCYSIEAELEYLNPKMLGRCRKAAVLEDSILAAE